MPRIPTPIDKTFIIAAVREGFEENLEVLLERTDRFVEEFADAFPFSPIGMLDALVGYITSLAGLATSLPFRGLQRITREDILPLLSYRHSVTTLERALALPFEEHAAFLQAITFTSENSLAVFLIQAFSRWLYRLIRRIPFLLRLLRIQSELQFIDLVVDTAVKRIYKVAAFVRFVGMMLGFLGVLSWVGAQLNYLGMIFMILEGTLSDFILPQDSQRVGGTRKGQHRLNLRKGPDK